MKIVELGKFLKTKNLTEIVSEFCVNRDCIRILRCVGINARPASIPCKLPYILFWNFRIFFVFKNLTSVTVFNLKSPNFRHLLILTCSFHFWHLQSDNIRLSIALGSVRKVCWPICLLHASSTTRWLLFSIFLHNQVYFRFVQVTESPKMAKQEKKLFELF